MNDIYVPGGEPRRVVLPRDPNHEFGRFMHRATVEKRDDRYEDYLRELRAKGFSLHRAQVRAARDIRPYEVVEGDYNAFVYAGIDIMLDLIIGAGGTAYNNANARLGVGSSTTAWANTQTDLQTILYKAAMNATFPSRTSHTVTFKSDFTGSNGDGAWEEWAVFNSASANTGMMSRKVESLGTKSGGTWTLTTTLTLA